MKLRVLFALTIRQEIGHILRYRSSRWLIIYLREDLLVLRYDKRGIGTNHTILDSNIWGNLTLDDIIQDANKALAVLIHQPEVDFKRVTVLGHSEGTMIAPRVAMDNPDKVDNIVLMGAAG